MKLLFSGSSFPSSYQLLSFFRRVQYFLRMICVIVFLSLANGGKIYQNGSRVQQNSLYMITNDNEKLDNAKMWTQKIWETLRCKNEWEGLFVPRPFRKFPFCVFANVRGSIKRDLLTQTTVGPLNCWNEPHVGLQASGSLCPDRSRNHYSR